MNYKIKFPVGDWDDNGHGSCEWFIVESNKPVEAVREAHLRFKEISKFDIGQIVNEYQEPKLNVNQYDYLDENNLLPEDDLNFDPDDVTPEDVIEIWLNCLMHADETLVLTVDESTQGLPSIVMENQPDTIRTPGYGAFTKAT